MLAISREDLCCSSK